MSHAANQSTISEVFLLGFQSLHIFRTTLFVGLLVIYMASIVGNLLIIGLVLATQHLLHTPMYFFLCQLSTTDVLITTTVCPYLLHITWNGGAIMTFSGCILQLYVFSVTSITECCLLTAMSYDRYVAICKPLHYPTIMTFTVCICLVSCCWFLGFFLSLVVNTMIYHLHFCGSNIIDHLFCDYSPLVRLSCSDTTVLKIIVFLILTPETVVQAFFIVTTYLCIFLSILRMSSGRQKVFSTCSSHLAVVCMYYGTLIAIYVAPSQGRLTIINKILSLVYTVGTPLLNPIIYSLKNKEIKDVLQKHFKGGLKLKCRYV
ncbi:hypothetical protein GDO86_020392 [Hymenochirus boettgeri]|uniref:Olfactory receptor n=1 Tax=Hymenochirus boettgeri TaxID=247094 RepID=A0A8T2INL3_9PIPI|nr:hypothetical protein GDO86_020392 [Hymenochirus boettgeri]